METYKIGFMAYDKKSMKELLQEMDLYIRSFETKSIDSHIAYESLRQIVYGRLNEPLFERGDIVLSFNQEDWNMGGKENSTRFNYWQRATIISTRKSKSKSTWLDIEVKDGSHLITGNRPVEEYNWLATIKFENGIVKKHCYQHALRFTGEKDIEMQLAEDGDLSAKESLFLHLISGMVWRVSDNETIWMREGKFMFKYRVDNEDFNYSHENMYEPFLDCFDMDTGEFSFFIEDMLKKYSKEFPAWTEKLTHAFVCPIMHGGSYGQISNTKFLKK